METYSLLREFADSWMLLFMFLFFCGIIVWVIFRKSGSYRDTAEIIFRHEDKPLDDDDVRDGGKGGSVMSNKDDEFEGVPTTGHEWDGIREYDKPMPRWWLWTFYATMVWGLIYSIMFPAWPLVSGATAGLLGWSSRGQVEAELVAFAETHADIDARLASVELAEITADPELNQYATSAGAAVYRTWCVQCHGSGAAGAVGFPNLLDDDWLWGGSLEEIHYSVSHGIRNDVSEDAHYSEMPAFGDLLASEEIEQVVNYVMSLSGDPQDAEQVEAGAQIFVDQCSSCHGEDGTGDRSQGAPNLTDAVWLYGGDHDTLVQTVTYSRYGVMPPWLDAVGGRLTEAQVRAVSTYVHQLGGGE